MKMYSTLSNMFIILLGLSSIVFAQLNGTYTIGSTGDFADFTEAVDSLESHVYFVLHGHLSPLDGIGPDELGLDRLEQRLAAGDVNEIILATNSTVEGEATAHFIAELARKYRIHASRIAHGVPMGGELEYIDSSTLAHAFNGRKKI